MNSASEMTELDCYLCAFVDGENNSVIQGLLARAACRSVRRHPDISLSVSPIFKQMQAQTGNP